MPIPSVNYSTVARLVNHINNPNYVTGTMIEEIPADLGRSYQGYKRGGVIEGAERLRKELMSAVVWLFGIPAFNKIGNVICEKFLNIPTNLDYSNAKEGNDAIANTVHYLTTGEIKGEFKDVSDLAKYGEKFIGQDALQLTKKIKAAKQITSLSAIVLNCLAMGVIIPKINQALTKKKLQNQKAQETPMNVESMDSFIKRTKPNETKNDVNFKGLADLAGTATYLAENNNKFRLIVTDIPMITGRMLTARNKFEALEILVIDGGSIYFYNFFANHIKDALAKGAGTPSVNPIVAETIAGLDEKTIKAAFENMEKNPNATLKELFNDPEIANNIYKQATFNKYGKINKFVPDSTLNNIDKNVVAFLSRIKDEVKSGNNIDLTKFSEVVKKTNLKNASFLGIGLLGAIAGLSYILPKVAFRITRMITGKNTFSGITDYDGDKKKA